VKPELSMAGSSRPQSAHWSRLGWRLPAVFMTTLAGLWLLSSQLEPPSHPPPTATASLDVDRDKNRDGQDPIATRLTSSSVGAPVDTSTAADSDWRVPVHGGLTEDDYGASENDGGGQATNRAHNPRTYFRDEDIQIEERTVAETKLPTTSLAGSGGRCSSR